MKSFKWYVCYIVCCSLDFSTTTKKMFFVYFSFLKNRPNNLHIFDFRGYWICRKKKMWSLTLYARVLSYFFSHKHQYSNNNNNKKISYFAKREFWWALIWFVFRYRNFVFLRNKMTCTHTHTQTRDYGIIFG